MEVQLHEGAGAMDVLYDPPPRLTTDDGSVTVGLQGPGGDVVRSGLRGRALRPTACAGSTLTNTRYTPTP